MQFEFIDKLKNVPWNRFNVSEFCLSSQVPNALYLAVTESDSIRLETQIYDLLESAAYNNLELQEISIFMIPFLWDMLAFDSNAVKAFALRILCDLEQSSSPLEKMIILQPDTIRFSPVYFAEAVPLQIACRAALSVGIFKYIKMLETDDQICRMRAARLLSAFREFEARLSDILKDAMFREKDGETKHAMSEALRFLRT